ncbi:MAG: hypothetical protein PHI94_04080 [Eubacteriaceae bacterium]|nr:hypothetical protein [Eubacteriaceae bacterium]
MKNLWKHILLLAAVLLLISGGNVLAADATESADFVAPGGSQTAIDLLNAHKTPGAQDSTWDSSTNTLTLKGIDFTTSAGNAIFVSSGTTIVLEAGTVNTIRSTFSGSDPTLSATGIGVFPLSQAPLTFQGSGTLNVSGGDNSSGSSYGISSPVSVTIDGPTVNAFAGTAFYDSIGLNAPATNTTVTVNAGALNAASNGTSYSSHSEGIACWNYNVTGGSIDLKGNDHALYMGLDGVVSTNTIKGSATRDGALEAAQLAIGTIVDTDTSFRTILVIQNPAVAKHATITPPVPTYTITPRVTGTGGTISPATAQTVNEGDSAVFTMTPADGYIVSTVLVDGDDVTSQVQNNTYTFTNVTADHTIAVSFKATYTITASSGTGGTITPSGKATYASGAKAVYTFTADAGYTLSDVLVDGVSVMDNVQNNIYTFDTVTSDHTIAASFSETPITRTPHISYLSHVQNAGWETTASRDGAISGTTHRALRMEALKASVTDDKGNAIAGLGITYQAHIENIGWQDTWGADGSEAGTTGQALRDEAFKIKLTGDKASQYDVYYRVHVQNYGWMNWASNGNPAGTTGMAHRGEAIQIVIVEKGSGAPTPTPPNDQNAAFIKNGNPLNNLDFLTQ